MFRPTCALFACAVLAIFTGCTEPDQPIAKNAAAADQTTTLTTVGTTECASPKVLVCHFPPGNPQNAQDICIGEPAVQAHLDNHGDLVGSCNPSPPPPPACTPHGAPCTSDAECCSAACGDDGCYDRT